MKPGLELGDDTAVGHIEDMASLHPYVHPTNISSTKAPSRQIGLCTWLADGVVTTSQARAAAISSDSC